MSHEVYANGMAISCKAGDGKSICAFPDVCFTPPQTPATPLGVPIPYPNTGLSSDTADGSTSVKISGKEVMLKSASHFSKSSGDEAGNAPKKGLINSKITGKVHFASWSMDVRIEGENVDRHLDLTTHNHGSGANENLTWPEVEKASMKGLTKKPCKGCPKPDTDKVYENLRPKTPSSTARNEINTRKKRPRICVACKQSKRRLSADHVVPLAEIVEIPGFACLSEADQKRIADHKDNMAGLCKSCNSSKQDKLWNEWKEHKARGFKIHKATRDKGDRVAAKCKSQLVKMVREAPCV